MSEVEVVREAHRDELEAAKGHYEGQFVAVREARERFDNALASLQAKNERLRDEMENPGPPGTATQLRELLVRYNVLEARLNEAREAVKRAQEAHLHQHLLADDPILCEVDDALDDATKCLASITDPEGGEKDD